MLERRCVLGAEFGQHLGGQHLAELHAPLVKGEDVPDDPLCEDLVLVERDERAEGFGRQGISEQGVGGVVALEGLVRDEFFRHAFRAALLCGLSEGEGLCLRKEVGHELVMVVADRIVRGAETDEVARDHAGSLMDELIEGVLAVGAGFAPDDRAGAVGDSVAMTVYGLAIALHVELLEIRGQACEILVVGQYSVAFRTVSIRIEDAEQSHDDRQVAAEGSCCKMAVHFVIPLEHLLVVGRSDGDHQRQADG